MTTKRTYKFQIVDWSKSPSDMILEEHGPFCTEKELNEELKVHSYKFTGNVDYVLIIKFENAESVDHVLAEIEMKNATIH